VYCSLLDNCLICIFCRAQSRYNCVCVLYYNGRLKLLMWRWLIHARMSFVLTSTCCYKCCCLKIPGRIIAFIMLSKVSKISLQHIVAINLYFCATATNSMGRRHILFSPCPSICTCVCIHTWARVWVHARRRQLTIFQLSCRQPLVSILYVHIKTCLHCSGKFSLVLWHSLGLAFPV